MKFWQSTYLIVLVVFLLAFDLSSWFMLQKSCSINEQADTEQGISEFTSINNSLSYILDTLKKNTGIADMKSIIASYTDDYSKIGLKIEIYSEGSPVFSNTFGLDARRNEIVAKTKTAVYREINGELWLFVGGKMGFDKYTLVISRPSVNLQMFRSEMIESFTRLSIYFSCGLSIILLLVLFRITAPIRKLNAAIRSFAGGSYQTRVKVKGKSEISELEENFNFMACSVVDSMNELERANREKQNFINNLTHELKTPITAIKGYGQFLMNANCAEQEKVMAINYIVENIARLDLLSGKLMEVLYLKQETIKPVPIALYELFCEIDKYFSVKLKEKNINFIADLKADQIMGDKILLYTLFCNLVDNSIKALESSGVITFSSRTEDNRIYIAVLDNGKGIPPEDIAKVQGAFYVVDKSRSRRLGGIGLGLSICKQIAVLHKAEMQIESELNHYTKISVIFNNYFTSR